MLAAGTRLMAEARSGQGCSASMMVSCRIPAWSWASPALRPRLRLWSSPAFPGFLPGAFSMAAGEFISMLSQKEMFEHQIAQERDELERYPNEEAEEFALIYAARGLPLAQARDVAAKMTANPEKALDTGPRRARAKS